jgi:antitoxin YefM
MTIMNATDARAKLYSLIDETADTHEPIVITEKGSNAVLLSQNDWKPYRKRYTCFQFPV